MVAPRSVKLFWGGAAIALFGALANCTRQSNIPIEERFPGPWREETNLGVVRALVKAKIAGCGQLKHRLSSVHSDEYLVHCTRDGANWLAYVVRVDSGSVRGPEAPQLPD